MCVVCGGEDIDMYWVASVEDEAKCGDTNYLTFSYINSLEVDTRYILSFFDCCELYRVIMGLNCNQVVPFISAIELLNSFQ